MDDLATFVRILPFLIPVVVLQIALMVIALVDAVKRERVRGGSKVIWILVIVLVNVIGPVIYLLFGREEAGVDGD